MRQYKIFFGHHNGKSHESLCWSKVTSSIAITSPTCTIFRVPYWYLYTSIMLAMLNWVNVYTYQQKKKYLVYYKSWLFSVEYSIQYPWQRASITSPTWTPITVVSSFYLSINANFYRRRREPRNQEAILHNLLLHTLTNG